MMRDVKSKWRSKMRALEMVELRLRVEGSLRVFSRGRVKAVAVRSLLIPGETVIR